MQGFVYIWFDRKHFRFYIGSHFGTIDDGYICSSSWMKNALKRRPQDFKRKILEWSTREQLLEAEQKWLDQIEEHELGVRYYNLKKSANGGFSRSACAASRKYRLGRPLTTSHKAKLSRAHKNKPWSQKRRKAQTGKYTNTLMYEHNGQSIGTIKDAIEYSGLSKATINRYCDPTGTYSKPEWRKYRVK